MYDWIRLAKKIYRSHSQSFWFAMLFLLLFLILFVPITNGIVNIIAPPEPTATPRPTPDINQTMRIGEPLLVQDTYFTVLGYESFDSKCNPYRKSNLKESTKTVVVEFWARHVGLNPVTIESFYVRDNLGTNYKMRLGNVVGSMENECLPALSGRKTSSNTSVTIETGYGEHFYVYAEGIPADIQDPEMTFIVNYSYNYDAKKEIISGTSKVSVKLINDGVFEKPDKMLMGAPTSRNLFTDRTAQIENIAMAIYDTHRAGGDNANDYYYLEIMFQNISDKMLNINFDRDFVFNVVDGYGVVLPAGLSMNSGYNSNLSPGETQKYFLTWQMEQTSAQMKYFVLQVKYRAYGDDLFFIEIPFKDSMLVSATPTPFYSGESLLARATEQPTGGSQYPTATPLPTCINALPPRLTAGDTAGVTYTPPMANRLRKDPGFKGSIITMIQPGRTFYVMDGPTCADGLYWYYVNFNGYYGWTAESDDGKYWLEKKEPSTYYRY